MVTDSILDAVAVSLGPMLAVIVGAVINARAAQRATEAAHRAQEATVQAAHDAIVAQEQASIAQAQASEAARQLIITARDSNLKLDAIASVGQATHKIVNNQRTVMLNVVAAAFRDRIAGEESPRRGGAARSAERQERCRVHAMSPLPENIGDAVFFISIAIGMLLALVNVPREKPKRRPPWG